MDRLEGCSSDAPLALVRDKDTERANALSKLGLLVDLFEHQRNLCPEAYEEVHRMLTDLYIECAERTQR